MENKPKEAYETPELMELGTIEEMTRGCTCGNGCDCEGNYKPDK